MDLPQVPVAGHLHLSQAVASHVHIVHCILRQVRLCQAPRRMVEQLYQEMAGIYGINVSGSQ